MLKTAGDTARTVVIEAEKLQRHRAKKCPAGMIAVMLENFRSSDNAETMYLIDNLIHLKYPGDSKV